MFHAFFDEYPNCSHVSQPTEDDVEHYEGRLPTGLIELWSEYGYGVYMDGYLKIVHPAEYTEILSTTYAGYTDKEIPFATTALGDLLVWSDDAVRLINYRYGISSIVSSSKIERLFESRLLSENYLDKYFGWSNYLPAKERLGAPEYDECYAYEPILALGGFEKIENMSRVKIKEHLNMFAQLVGSIE